MPLSEDEQRILTEIEHQLRASDPDLARQVSETTVYSDPLRRTRLATAGLVLGLAVTIVLLFTVNAYAAFIIGFGMMFASAFYLERNIRHLGRVGMNQLANTVRSSGVRDMFGVPPGREDSSGEHDDGA
ncbi:MAG: DUF3040 domain-containing protein [Acidimicrobiales bacterium]